MVRLILPRLLGDFGGLLGVEYLVLLCEALVPKMRTGSPFYSDYSKRESRAVDLDNGNGQALRPALSERLVTWGIARMLFMTRFTSAWRSSSMVKKPSSLP